MHAARKLSREIEELFAEADRAVGVYAGETGLTCPAGCGGCCRSPEISVTVLDMLPMALAMVGEGQAEAVLEGLDAAVRCPVFEDHGGGKGRCLRYETRPTLCRLFGFAGVADKHGLVRLAVCRAQKERGLVVDEEVRPPAFAEFGRRLAALAPEYGTEIMPIRAALRVALEKVLLLERFAELRLSGDRQAEAGGE